MSSLFSPLVTNGYFDIMDTMMEEVGSYGVTALLIFIAGELGGMGLIRNAVTQGREAVENIAKSIRKDVQASYDLIVVGSGPAGISATLAAKELKLRVLTLEQDTLGGTVYIFPRAKIVMTSSMDLPLYGKVNFKETSKCLLMQPIPPCAHWMVSDIRWMIIDIR